MEDRIQSLDRIHELYQQAIEAQDRLGQAVNHLANKMKIDAECVMTLMWVYLRRALDETDAEPLEKLMAKGLVREIDDSGNRYVDPYAFPEYLIQMEDRTANRNIINNYPILSKN